MNIKSYLKELSPNLKYLNHIENKEEDQDIEEDLTMEEIDHLKDEDLIEYNDFLEEESEIDAQTLRNLEG